jgi:hypothetical protein
MKRFNGVRASIPNSSCGPLINEYASSTKISLPLLAVKNLRKEGLKGYLVGDLQTDVQLYFINNSSSK